MKRPYCRPSEEQCSANNHTVHLDVFIFRTVLARHFVPTEPLITIIVSCCYSGGIMVSSKVSNLTLLWPYKLPQAWRIKMESNILMQTGRDFWCFSFFCKNRGTRRELLEFCQLGKHLSTVFVFHRPIFVLEEHQYFVWLGEPTETERWGIKKSIK